MMRFAQIAIIAIGLAFGLRIAPADEPHVKPVTDYVLANVKPWLSDPLVVGAINRQNIEYAKLTNYEINKLDNGCIDRSDKRLIDSKMNNELSVFLRKKKESANGVTFEIFVFDSKGLNIRQTDLTRGFNQGDEAKYWKTYQVGPDAIFVDKFQHRRGQTEVIVDARAWMARCVEASCCSLTPPQVTSHQVT